MLLHISSYAPYSTLIGVQCLDGACHSQHLKLLTGILHGPRNAARADPKLGRNILCPAIEGLHHRNRP